MIVWRTRGKVIVELFCAVTEQVSGARVAEQPFMRTIGGHKPPDITPWVRTPYQWQGRTKPQDITPL